MRLLLFFCATLLLLAQPLTSGPAHAQEGPKDVWTGVSRVVAVGDVHGDFEKFVAVLRLARLIDERNLWTGGKTHLVQTGDVLDRGPDSRKVMDLLMALEGQAQKAGGRVHALIGNHEAMNVAGDLRYVSDEEFAAFGDPPRQSPIPRMPLGSYPHHREAFSPQGKYGRWIVSHNAVVRINDTLFAHGGISPRYARRDLHRINEDVRQELLGQKDYQTGVSSDPEGPLWYRGFAEPGQEAVLRAALLQVLAGQHARRMVIGHTVQEHGIVQLFEGQLVLIDVGMSRRMINAAPMCLLIERRHDKDLLSVVDSGK